MEVVGSDGEPVGGALVEALPWQARHAMNRAWGLGLLFRPEPSGTPIAHATTDDTGLAVLAGLDSGRVHLRVTAASMAVAQVTSAWARGSPPRRVVVALRRAESLEGVVRDRDGASLGGFAVVVSPRATSFGPAPAGLVLRTTTSPDGSYRIDGLAPGLLEVQVHAPDGWLVDVAHVRVPRVPRYDFALTYGATLRGRVLDAITHEPLAGATVTFLDDVWTAHASRVARAVTEEDGSYSARTWRNAVTVRAARVVREGRGTVETALLSRRVSAGVVVEHDFLLPAEARVAGRVGSPSGPVAGARVVVSFPRLGPFDDLASVDTLAGADGKYAIGGLPSGTAVVRAFAPGLVQRGTSADLVWGPAADHLGDVSETLRTAVLAGETTTFDVALWPHPDARLVDSTFSGRVVRPDGSPAPWADVVVSANAEHHRAVPAAGRTVSGSDGSFVVHARGAPGSFGISASLGGMPESPFQRGQRVRDGAQGLRVVLEPQTLVRGRVTSRGGRPVAGARVLVGTEHQWKFETVTLWDDHPEGLSGADGTFAVPIVPQPGWASDSDETLDGLIVGVEHEAFAPGFSRPFTRADVEAGTPADVALCEGATIRGRVTWEDSGTPVAGAWIVLHDDSFSLHGGPFPPTVPPPPSRSVEALTDADGRWTIDHLVPAAYRVAAHLAGSAGSAGSDVEEVDVADAAVVRLVLRRSR